MPARPDRARFGEVWPQVSGRLHRTLVRRGTPSDEADDLVQDTAVRALQTGVVFDSAEDLFRWSLVVARRMAIDAHRHQQFVVDIDLTDRASPDLVDRQVEARIVFEAVAVAIRQLSAADRRALLQVVDDEAAVDRRDAVRMNVQRHRARARLRAKVGGLLAP
jgi:DNA-directed RNA polymerase specialized sigma24 family protein